MNDGALPDVLATLNVPAETLERAWTTGAWPFEFGDERAPRWWCERCSGTGVSDFACPQCDVRDGATTGYTSVPADSREVDAVLRLGPRVLLTVVELARVLAVNADAAVVFRVMRHGVLLDRIRANARDWWPDAVARGEDRRSAVLRIAFALEREAEWLGEPAWREGLTYRIQELDDGTWPVLWSLGRTPTHLLSCEKNVVVLAVQAIGGGT